MKNFIVLFIVASFLFSCESNLKTNDSDKSNLSQSSIDTTALDSQQTKMISKKEHDEAGFKKIAPKIETKEGEKPKEGGDPNAEGQALRLRRAHTQFNNGTKYYKDGEIQKAIDAFKTSLEYKPDNDKAFYNLGKIYYDMGQKDLALSYYSDAVSINENDSVSLLGIGLIYYERGKYPEALEYYNRAIDVAPTYAMAYFNRGTMLGQNRQYEQSLSDLTNAIKYEPEFSDSYVNRGLAYFYIKDMDNACKDWKKAAEMGNKKGQDAVRIYCSDDK